MASAFSDSLMASGGVVPPPLRSQELQKVWPWNFYQMLVFIRRHEIKKFFDITGPVCKLQTKIPKIPIFGNATSRHANLTKFCRNINIDVRNKPWKFQIDISKIGYFTEHSVKCRKSWSVKYRTARKIQNRSRDFTKFTRWCHVIHI